MEWGGSEPQGQVKGGEEKEAEAEGKEPRNPRAVKRNTYGR